MVGIGALRHLDCKDLTMVASNSCKFVPLLRVGAYGKDWRTSSIEYCGVIVDNHILQVQKACCFEALAQREHLAYLHHIACA